MKGRIRRRKADADTTDDTRAERAVMEIGADDWYVGWEKAQAIILRLITEIRADEREKCADACDELTKGALGSFVDGCMSCADTIRGLQ
jgi:hypothetical protein